MNQTSNISSRCEICQFSHGFSSADQRAIVVMVVLTGIALILCYVGVLWFAIRTRFISSDDSVDTKEDVHRNQAFDDDEENIPHMNIIPTPPLVKQPVVFIIEDEMERL